MGYAPGWQVRCRACGLTVEAGRAGPLVRISAWGRSYTPGRCCSCGRWRILVIEKRTDPERNARPAIGFAPGWRIRCGSCGRTNEAAAAGLIVQPDEPPRTITGPCSQCHGDRRLFIERSDTLP